jgi:hypothetical protein
MDIKLMRRLKDIFPDGFGHTPHHTQLRLPPFAAVNFEAWETAERAAKEQGLSSFFGFANDWARTTQAFMKKGKSFGQAVQFAHSEAIHHPSISKADISGGKAFTFFAVKLLAGQWKYGEQLKMWWNNLYGQTAHAAQREGKVHSPIPGVDNL